MTSDRQLAANRQNSRRSSGPRSAAGERRASRNALRHGLAAITHRAPAPTDAIDRLARAICGPQTDDPLLLGAAVAIAENHFALRVIKAQQIAVIERLRDTTAIALAKGDNSFDLGKAKFLETWLINREIEATVPKLLEKYNIELPLRKNDDSRPLGPALPDYRDPHSSDIVPLDLKVLLEDSESIEVQEWALDLAAKHLEERERNECEALDEAVPDLKRLDRYERGAWSQHKRAVYEFMNIKLMRTLGQSENRSLP
jgi:hypothetical protein